MKAYKAAREALIAGGNLNPTEDQVKRLAKTYENNAMATLLKLKDAYSSSHNATKIAQENDNKTDLIAFSNFFNSFQRPVKGQWNSSISQAFTDLELTNHEKGQGYGFKKTVPVNDLQQSSQLSPEERNYLKVIDASGVYPDSDREFARCAINSAAGAISSDAQPMPDELGSKIEVGVAATLAFLDPTKTYYARTDTAPGQDLFRTGDDITFECKFSKSEKGDINDRFGGSQPSSIKFNKFYVFLSSDRSYFINSSILSGLGAVGSDVIPRNSSRIENQKYNSKLMEHLFNQQELKQKFIEILAEFAEKTTVYYKEGSRVVRAPRTGNLEDAESNIRKALRDKNKTGLPPEVASYTQDSLIPDPPTIKRLAGLIINQINASNEKNRYIESLRYMDMINDLFIERSITTAISGPVTAGGIRMPGMKEEAINQLNAGGTTNPTDDQINEKAIELYNGEWDYFLRDSNSGNLKPYGGLASQGSMGLTGKCFILLINYLIYAWNLKDDPMLTKLGQDFIQTAIEGASKAYGRQQAETKSGKNYVDKLKESEPDGSAMLIMNLINNPTTFTEEQKKILINQLYGDKDNPYQISDNFDFDSGTPTLISITEKIQNSDLAMSQLFIEFMRSESGRKNIINDFITVESFDLVFSDVVDVIQNYFDEKMTAFSMPQMSSDVELKSSYNEKFSQLQSLINNLKSEFVNSTDKYGMIIDGLRLKNIELTIKSNKFWTAFDREEMWGEGSDPDFDEKLFELFFKKTASSDSLTDKTTSQLSEISNKIFNYLSPDLIAFRKSLMDAILAIADQEIKNILPQAKTKIKQNLSQENLYNIENQYKLSLSSEELNAYNSLDREPQILQMLNADVIDERQAKVLRRTKDPLKALKRAFEENPYEDELNAPIRENKNNLAIYNKVIKELLKYSK